VNRSARFYLILLSCIVLLSAIRSGLFFSYYLLNPTHFITLFCENKTDVKKHCNGKCFLARISSENTSEQTDVKFDFTKLQTEVFYMEVPSFVPFSTEFLLKNSPFYYRYPFWENVSREVLRPPML
jgi:hypothetical protein